jgi:asparagine synthase (glutamine-hydrolysing)
MCGIVGRLTWDGTPVDRNLLARQCNALRHRGPDEEGIWVEGPVGLAMRRLKVVDLVGGQQPMDNLRCPRRNNRPPLRLIYNGEIYNAPALRSELEKRGHLFRSHSDTEVLLHALEEWGNDTWQQLNGMFAVALYDEGTGRLTLARDRFGIKPLYYSLGPDGLRFASEIKALLLDPSLDRIPKPRGHQRLFLPSLRSHAPHNFKSVAKLSPGTYLTVDAHTRSAESTSFAGMEPRPKIPLKRAEWLRGLDDRLASAVSRQLVADVPVGVFLSGGLDSSSIASYVNRLGRPLDSFHVHFSSPSYSEREDAARTARHLGLRHHEWEMPPPTPDFIEQAIGAFDEPFADASILPTFFLCEKTRAHVTAVLSGDGGDEIFAGYPTYLADRWARWYRRLPHSLQRLLDKMGAATPVSFRRISLDYKLKAFLAAAGRPQPLAHFGWQEMFHPDEKQRLFSPSFLSQELGDPTESFHRAFEEAGATDDLTAWMWLDRRTHLMDEYLVKVDRLSMAHSLEVRVPLLDNDVVEWAAQIPDEEKLGAWTTKQPLRLLMKDRLPKSVVRGAKRGFAPPLAEWLAGPLHDWAASVLSPTRVGRTNVFQPDTPIRLLTEHTTRHRDNSRRLWTILSFILWSEKKG